MADRKTYVGEPYTIPEQTVNPNGTIYTKVLAAPQEMSVKNIHVDIQKGQTTLEVSPKQYLKLVKDGLLPKSEQHDIIETIATQPYYNDHTKLAFILGSCTTTHHLYSDDGN